MEDVKKLDAEKVVPGASATPAETVTPEQAAVPEQQPDIVAQEKTRFQSRIDQLTAARRAAEERARLAEERLIRLSQEKPTGVPGGRPGEEVKMVGQMTKDDWLTWHDEDPLAATEYVSDIRANQKAQQIMHQMQTAGEYSSVVNEVYKNHPELKDVMEGKKAPEEVPFWQVYDEVAREMPDAQQIAKGPYIVMKEAERRMKERELAEKEKKIATNAAVEEQNRQVRVAGSHTLGSSPRPPSAGSVKLSDTEEKIARKMGMSPEEYAKNKKVK